MHPFTFLACTYNLWKSPTRKDERRGALQRFLELNRPDVLCVQELSPDAVELVSQTLPSLAHVDDAFAGWTQEGNVFWNAKFFDLIDYGAEPIGQLKELRRLFWVRLEASTGQSIVVATAHFSAISNVRELTERINVRVGQAEEAASALDGLLRPDEAVLFMGDFNDHFHPLQVLRAAGYEDSFMALGRDPSITHPAFPKPGQPPRLLDWMMHRGPVRPTLTSVVDFYVDAFPPSDHKPILTTYTLTGNDGIDTTL